MLFDWFGHGVWGVFGGGEEGWDERGDESWDEIDSLVTRW